MKEGIFVSQYHLCYGLKNATTAFQTLAMNPDTPGDRRLAVPEDGQGGGNAGCDGSRGARSCDREGVGAIPREGFPAVVAGAVGTAHIDASAGGRLDRSGICGTSGDRIGIAGALGGPVDVDEAESGRGILGVVHGADGAGEGRALASRCCLRSGRDSECGRHRSRLSHRQSAGGCGA